MPSTRTTPLLLAGWTAALLLAALLAVSRAGAAGIQDVTWLDFTYVVNGEDVTVVGGQFAQASPPMFVAVSQPVFGDLNGDGEEEAVIITAVNFGGSGTFTEALVYTLSDGNPVVAGTIPGGDRAYGGIQSVTIADGRVLLQRNQPGADGPACCPSYTASESWGFQAGILGEFVGSRFISPFEPVAAAEAE